MFPTNFNPDLIVLPFKACLAATGEPLTFDQAADLFARGEARSMRIERSYREAPETIGWTIFQQARLTYIHAGKPLYKNERDARRHIRHTQPIGYGRKSNPSPSHSRLHI
jgi:hypothetical protein